MFSQQNTSSRTKQKGYTFYFAKQLNVQHQRKDARVFSLNPVKSDTLTLQCDINAANNNINNNIKLQQKDQVIVKTKNISQVTPSQDMKQQECEQNEFIKDFQQKVKGKISADEVCSLDVCYLQFKEQKQQNKSPQVQSQSPKLKQQPQKSKPQIIKSGTRQSIQSQLLISNDMLQNLNVKFQDQKTHLVSQYQQNQNSFLLDTDTYKQICLQQQNQKKVQFISSFDMKTLTNLDQSICYIHEKQYQIVCITDKKLICSHCAIFGEHKNHVLAPYKDIKKGIQTKKDEVCSVIKGYKDFLLNIKQKSFIQSYIGLIDEKKRKMKGQVKQYVDSIRQFLSKYENNILSQVEKFYQNVEEKVFSAIKQVSNSQCSRNYQKWQKQALHTIQQLNYYDVNNQKQIEVFLQNFKYENQQNDNNKFNLQNNSLQNKGTEYLKIIKNNLSFNLDTLMNVSDELRLKLQSKFIKKVEQFIKFQFRNNSVQLSNLNEKDFLKNGNLDSSIQQEMEKLDLNLMMEKQNAKSMAKSFVKSKINAYMSPKTITDRHMFTSKVSGQKRQKHQQFMKSTNINMNKKPINQNQVITLAMSQSQGISLGSRIRNAKSIGISKSPTQKNMKSPARKQKTVKQKRQSEAQSIFQEQNNLHNITTFVIDSNFGSNKHILNSLKQEGYATTFNSPKKKPFIHYNRRQTEDDLKRFEDNSRISLNDQHHNNFDALSISQVGQVYVMNQTIEHQNLSKRQSPQKNVKKLLSTSNSRMIRCKSVDPRQNNLSQNKSQSKHNQNQKQNRQHKQIKLKQPQRQPMKQLQKYKKSKQQMFDLSNCNLKDTQILYFVQKATAVRKIKSLKLCGNLLTNNGFEKIMPYLSICKMINIGCTSINEGIFDIMLKKREKIGQLKQICVGNNMKIVNEKRIKQRLNELQKNEISVTF